jgi:hypothetical protein
MWLFILTPLIGGGIAGVLARIVTAGRGGHR